MNEIKLIFIETFKEYNERESKKIWFVLAESRARILSFCVLLLGVCLFIGVIFESYKKESLFLFIVLSFVVFCLYYTFIQNIIDSTWDKMLNNKIQEEFLPKLTQEQIDLIASIKAGQILKHKKGWDNLSFKQALGFEHFSKSINYNEMLMIIRKDLLTNIVAQKAKV